MPDSARGTVSATTPDAPPLPPGVTIECLPGTAAAPYITDLDRLRIEVFREFPYLWNGRMQARETLPAFARTAAGVLVLARAEGQVVGASVGLPLALESEHTRAPFEARGHALEGVYYFAESVLTRAWRGKGIGVHFMARREAHAQAHGPFRTTCFAAVERPVDHPRRPADYVPLDAFWTRRGYVRHPELRTTFTWQDLDEEQKSPKPMVFWLKDWSRE